MPDLIPFTPSDNNYNLGVTLGSERVWFYTRWNSYEKAWYFDLYDDAGEVIAIGTKVVLGVMLGRQHPHSFFTRHAFKAVDTTGVGKDAGYDDLGARVVVVHVTADEIFDEMVA